MHEFAFDPPLTLKDGSQVRTLDDAVAFMTRQKGDRWEFSWDGVLRRLEGAHDEEAQRDAANAFRGWAEREDFLTI